MIDTSQTNELRPVQHLRQVMAICPTLSDLVNTAMNIREEMPDSEWPRWCFIPEDVWNTMCHTVHLDTRVSNEIMTIGTWRYGQGIYTFEPELLEALAESEINDKLPVEFFYRLPEWCIYIPTPGLKYCDLNLYGFYAHLSFALLGDRQVPILRIATDTPRGLGREFFPLAPRTMADVIDFIMEYSDPNADASIEGAKEWIKELVPLLSILLYICADYPEIDHSRIPGVSPSSKTAVKIKGKYKLFPASSPTIWQVGKQIAETLRKTRAGGGGKPGHQKRPHLRRGHWHGYWTGPRTGERTLTAKWLPPRIVAANTEDEDNAPEIDE